MMAKSNWIALSVIQFLLNLYIALRVRKAEPWSLYTNLPSYLLFQVRYPAFLVLIVIQTVMVIWLWNPMGTVNHLSIAYHLKHLIKMSQAQLDDSTPRCFLSVQMEKCCLFIAVCCTQSRYLSYIHVWLSTKLQLSSYGMLALWLVCLSPDWVVWVQALAREIALYAWTRHFFHNVSLHSGV